MPLTAAQILRATVVSGREDRVYCIGSFAKRVNFLAQQRRALNLVWALNEAKRLDNKPRVAVIGGGLVGVTAAAALIAHGAVVDIFEKGGRILHHQRKTAHRKVHPTINAWPFEKISLTTDLPFYDWSAGVCSQIAEAIASDLEKTMKDLGYDIHTGVAARDLAPIGTRLVRVVTTPPVRNSEGYDLVLITIGFGDEVGGDAAFEGKSYWENDNLESERDKDNKYQTFLVSGCGDGGLIDTLRIVYFGFQEGQLAFDLAAALCGTPLARDIRKAEQSAAALPEAERKKGGKVTKLLRDAYIKAATELEDNEAYRPQREMLKAALGNFDRVLYIGDRALAAPYSIKASPIHKLMVAHLSETQGFIKFEPDEAAATAAGQVTLGGYNFPLAATKVVIRHGAVPDFRNLLGTRELAALRKKQIGLNDKCADQAWPDDDDFKYPTPPNWTSNRQSRAYTKVRRDMARRAIEAIIPDATVHDQPGQFRVDIEAPPPPNAPKSLFRVPVDYVVEAYSDAL